MIFGQKEQFAIECIVEFRTDNTSIARSRLFIKNNIFGNFDELAVGGVIVFAMNSFLKFKNERLLGFDSEQEAFFFLFNAMYGDEWDLGIEGYFRDRFSVHELFEISISDAGQVIYLVSLKNNKSRILFGTRDGYYSGFLEVRIDMIEQMISDVRNYLEDGSNN